MAALSLYKYMRTRKPAERKTYERYRIKHFLLSRRHPDIRKKSGAYRKKTRVAAGSRHGYSGYSRRAFG